MQSDLERRMYGDEWITLQPADQTNLSMTKAAVLYFMAPFTGTLAELIAGYTTEAGTTPSLAVTIERSTTVLGTVSPDTAATPVSSGSLSSFVSRGEILNVKLASLGNADNDFTGIVVQLRFNRAASNT